MGSVFVAEGVDHGLQVRRLVGSFLFIYRRVSGSTHQRPTKVVAYCDDKHKGEKTLRHHQHHDQSHHSDLSKTKEKTSAAIVSVNEREVRYWIDVSQPFYLGLF
ncbi:hypothetical protein FPOAC2_12162 [Fusarium poae]